MYKFHVLKPDFKYDKFQSYVYGLKFDLYHVIAYIYSNNEQEKLINLITPLLSNGSEIHGVDILNGWFKTEKVYIPSINVYRNESYLRPVLSNHYGVPDYKHSLYPCTNKSRSVYLIRNKELFEVMAKSDFLSTSPYYYGQKVQANFYTNDNLVYEEIHEILTKYNIPYTLSIGRPKTALIKNIVYGVNLNEISDLTLVELFSSKTKGSYITLEFDKRQFTDEDFFTEYIADYIKDYKHRTKVRQDKDNYYINVTKNLESIIDFIKLANTKPNRLLIHINMNEMYLIKEKSEIYNELCY